MQTGTFPLGQVPLDATPSSAAPTPEPDPGWGVGLRFPRARRPLATAILAAAVAFTPDATAAPQTPDVLPVVARAPAARKAAPARPIIFVDTPAPDPTFGGVVLSRAPAALRPVTRPRTLDPVDGAHRADPGGWAFAPDTFRPRAARPPIRLPIDPTEAPAAPATPPAAGQAVPAIALAGRTTIIPRLAFVDAPAQVAAPLGTEIVLVRFPAARRPLPTAVQFPILPGERGTGVIEPTVLVRVPARVRPIPIAARLPIVAPDPRPGGLNTPEVLSRRVLARPPLTPAVRGPIVPVVVVVAPGVINPEVLTRAAAARRILLAHRRGVFLDPTTGGIPPDFAVMCVALADFWPRWVGTDLETPEWTAPVAAWPRAVSVTLVTPTWTVPTEAWPRAVNFDLECCCDD